MSEIPVYIPLSSSDILNLPIPPWRVKGILPQQGLATIFGPPGSGKSFLSIDIAAAIALGNDWFGFRVQQCPVTYVALEGEGGFPKRLRAWRQSNECNLPPCLQFIFGQEFDLTDEAYVKQLATVIKRGSVIIIDTLNRAASGKDENSSKDMSAILAGCKLLQRLTEGLIILIHHTGKDETKGLRGHSSLHAALDAAIEVHRDDEERSWSILKNKDDADGTEHAFRLTIETLGTDADGDPITSCAIEQLATVVVPSPSKLKGNQRLVLEAINTSLQSCSLLSYDDALEVAKRALGHIDTQNRAARARVALASLLSSRKLMRDSDTNLITLP